MLSSPRWTFADTLAVVALVAMLFRVFEGGPRPDDRQDTEHVRIDRVAAVLSHPLPAATEWLAMTSPSRVDGAYRCIGLAEASRDRICRSLRTNACRRAEETLDEMTRSLMPHPRTERDFSLARQRIATYARAYATLPHLDELGQSASSELILIRDSASCSRYRVFIEARLHGSENRQSG